MGYLYFLEVLIRRWNKDRGLDNSCIKMRDCFVAIYILVTSCLRNRGIPKTTG